MATKRLTSKQKHIRDAVAYMQKYMATYSDQDGYMNYREDTYIDDVLYGLGVSISPAFKGASGFREFKKMLRIDLATSE